MTEYTYKDVIIDPEDPRVEIGRRYWFANTPRECLWRANASKNTWSLIGVKHNNDNPFVADGIDSACIIPAKEPDKRYVPFDLSDPEVRKGLRGKVITAKDTTFSRYIEAVIGCFELRDTKVDGVDCQCWFMNGISAEELMNDWKFEDGSPVGKLVEVERWQS